MGNRILMGILIPTIQIKELGIRKLNLPKVTWLINDRFRNIY